MYDTAFTHVRVPDPKMLSLLPQQFRQQSQCSFHISVGLKRGLEMVTILRRKRVGENAIGLPTSSFFPWPFLSGDDGCLFGFGGDAYAALAGSCAGFAGCAIRR